MALGFVIRNNAIGSSTPVALTADQDVRFGCRLEALVANSTGIVYFGFFEDDAAALAGLTASTGFQLAAGQVEPIDVAFLQGDISKQTGNLKYLYLLSSSGTLGVACRGV